MVYSVYGQFLARKDCLILLVDIQKSMLDLCVQKDLVVKNCAALIDIVSIFEIPVLFSQHNAKKLGGFLPELVAKVQHPTIHDKLEFSCLENEGIAQALETLGRRTILLAGLETHVCIFHTGAHAVRLGYRVGLGPDHSLLQRARGASPRVRVDTLGPTIEGRPFLLVTLASPTLQGRLDEIRRGQRRLADPRTLRPGETDSLRAAQPAVVLIGNNIHSTEIGSSLMGMVLAQRLATRPELSRLLDSVVVLLVPSLNPDGLDTTVAWYRRYRGTRYEGGPLPWLYHRYAGHDNNRDWYMMTQVETRLVSRVLYHEWFPEAGPPWGVYKNYAQSVHSHNS